MNKQNPWKTLSTKTIYENDWIRLREDQVIRPDGNPGIYSVVETRIATGVIAINSNNEIYLVGQYRYPTKVYSWEIIEGGSDKNESAINAAKRELREEAGIVANSWKQLGDEIHLSNCHSSEVGYLFIAKELEFGEASPDETEVLSIKKVSLEQALEMVTSGEIKDAMSIIALQRAKDLLFS